MASRFELLCAGPRLAAVLALLSGCAPAVVDYAELRDAASARQRAAGMQLRVQTQTLAELLSRPLDADSAARIALLNNPGIRAKVEELGIAQAELVRARRLPNPTLEGAMRLHGDERPELELGAMLDLSELILVPLRSGAARASVEAARLAAVGAVLDFTFDVRRAFYACQAAAQLLEYRRIQRQSFEVAGELALRLHEAGNITELDLARHQSLLEESRLELQQAELSHSASREALSAMLGLWGRGTR